MEEQYLWKEEITDFCILVSIWTLAMKVMEELNMSRRVMRLMKYNHSAGHASNREHPQFTMEYNAITVTPEDS